jgi:hypothetical protein
MSMKRPTADAFGETLSAVPTCALDETGVREQRARYARLAPGVARVQREPEALLIEFHEGFDRGALEQALAVERECCPFFQFEFDDSKRRLRSTVGEPEQLPALEALAHAVGASPVDGG